MKKLVLVAVIAAISAGSAQAAVVGVLDYNQFVQSGTVTNNSGLVMTGFSINLTNDGVPNTPIWELQAPGPGLPGTPPATFSDFGDADGAFVASWSGLNVGGAGGTFNYSNLDIGVWTGVFTD